MSRSIFGLLQSHVETERVKVLRLRLLAASVNPAEKRSCRPTPDNRHNREKGSQKRGKGRGGRVSCPFPSSLLSFDRKRTSLGRVR